jgi:hypothetical protein
VVPWLAGTGEDKDGVQREAVGGGNHEWRRLLVGTVGAAMVCGLRRRRTQRQARIGDFSQWTLGQTASGRFNRVGWYRSNGSDPFNLF